MNNKEIRFSARIDTSEFDRTVKNLQDKIKDIYKSGDASRQQFETQSRLGRAGIGPGVSPQDRVRADQSEKQQRRELTMFVREQAKDVEKLTKEYDKQRQRLQEIDKLKKSDTSLGLGRVKLLNEETRILKEQASVRSQMAAKNGGINDALNMRDGLDLNFGSKDIGRLMTAYRRGGMGGVGRVAGGMFNRAAGAAGGGAVLAGGLSLAGGAVAAGSELFANVYDAPRRNLSNYAQGASFSNEQIRRGLGGRNYENALYSQEISKSNNLANKGIIAEVVKDIGGGIANTLKAAANGAGVGGTIGAIGGGLPGALAGASLGALGAGGAYGAYALGSSALNLVTGQYGSGLEARRASMAKEAFESQKDLNEGKRSALEHFQGNSAINLQSQRALGFSDQDLYGQFGQGTGAGFTNDQTRSSMMSILGSGGSTRGARGLGTLANSYARDLDITNAPQILGKLSGTMGGATQSEEALGKIFSKSVKLGLDTSEYREENRKFMEATAQAVYQSGSKTAQGADDIAERLASFIADKTPRGLEAAQTANQYTKGLETSTGGMAGMVGAAGILTSKSMGGMSAADRLRLATTSPDEMESFTEATKKRMAGGGADYKEKFAKIKEERANIGLQQDVESIGGTAANVRDMQEARRLSAKKNAGGTLTEKEQKKYEDYVNEAEQLSGMANLKGEPERQSFASRLLGGTQETGKTAPSEGSKGRVGDAINADAARFEGAINIIEQQFVPKIKAAADASQGLAQAFAAAMVKIGEATDPKAAAEAAKAAAALFRTMSSGNPGSQPQVGTPNAYAPQGAPNTDFAPQGAR